MRNKRMIQTKLSWAVFVALGVCCVSPVWAANDGIVTDRPSVVESSDVVGKGRFQIEAGVDYQRDKNAGVKTLTFTTPTLFRLGVSENFELRVETDGRVRERTEALGVSDARKGWAHTAIGFKWHMQDGDGKTGKPGIGWLIHAALDSSSQRFRRQGVRPSARVAFEWDLPNDMSLGVMPGLIRDKDRTTGERFTAGILAAVLGKELNDKVQVFAEVAARGCTGFCVNGFSVFKSAAFDLRIES